MNTSILKNTFLALALASMAVQTPAALAAVAQSNPDGIARNLSIHRNGDRLEVRADIVLDDVNLKSNHQLYITPVIGDGENTVALPAVLVNGRNMQFALERGVLKAADKNHPVVLTSVRRQNGKPQTISYSTTVDMADWMLRPATRIDFPIDSCGCGVPLGTDPGQGIPVNLNPAPEMKRAYLTPQVTELPVSIHEGKARVQFEVDRTELHAEPYRAKGGQLIDNRKELKVIDDSIHYALTDPNVEIAEIDICGYASPESPYLHNQDLATGRSRALAEYIAGRYNLPQEKAKYDAVPENWGEFREMVVSSGQITEQQRKDLLELIDAPAYGPSDYDAKEKTLKTDPKFAKLYRELILPKWFPVLRATKFQIKTRLKPMSDEKLSEIILQTPEKMSLNQMFRVANLYTEGSEEFDRAIDIALEKYGNDPVANLNAAISVLNREDVSDADLAKAAEYLEKAGDSAEAENARGILETYRGNFEAARQHFEKALPMPEAARNLKLIQ